MQLEIISYAPAILIVGLIILAWTATSVLYVCLLERRLRASEGELRELKGQIAMFAEASINVAKKVDRYVPQSVEGQGARREVSSRRWILEEAKERLNKGEDLLDISIPLGLCRDEVRLLNKLHKFEAVSP